MINGRAFDGSTPACFQRRGRVGWSTFTATQSACSCPSSTQPIFPRQQSGLVHELTPLLSRKDHPGIRHHSYLSVRRAAKAIASRLLRSPSLCQNLHAAPYKLGQFPPKTGQLAPSAQCGDVRYKEKYSFSILYVSIRRALDLSVCHLTCDCSHAKPHLGIKSVPRDCARRIANKGMNL